MTTTTADKGEQECREAFEQWRKDRYGYLSVGEFAYMTALDAYKAAWNRRANTTPVQAEQSLEVVLFRLTGPDGKVIYSQSRDLAEWYRDNARHECDELTDHAKSTAALAQKDAFWKRVVNVADAQTNQYIEKCKALEKEVATLRANLAEAEKDARNWRQYQARKQAIIAAGMGKNPLRDAALSSQQEGEKACTT